MFIRMRALPSAAVAGDVALAGHGAVDSILRGNVGNHFFSQRHVDIQNGDFGTQARQLTCNGLTQTGCAAGDKGCMARNIHDVDGLMRWV
jgi:hypothetical protein